MTLGVQELTPATENLLRTLAPQVLGVLARRCGDFAAAEDAVQEALLAAAGHWPREGVPDNPRGWLIQTAHRSWTDHVRSEAARRRREENAVLLQPPPDDAAPGEDDTLTLVFLCCHPALAPASAIALTLRAVGGLTTAEIATAFLVPETTMAQRISRAKQRVKASGPAEGLSVLQAAETVLKGHHHVDAVRAHLLEQSGERQAVAAHYAAAAARATNLAERDHLTKKAAELGSGSQ